MNRPIPAPAPPLSRSAMALAVAGIVLVYLAVRLPLLDVPLDRDEGVFGWIGQSILRGDLPYRDVFDHKPPGVFYLYAAALTVVPPTAAGVHGFLLVWNAGTLAAVAGLTRCLAGGRAALWAALVFAIVSAAPSLQGFTASTEMLLLLPLTTSVWCVVVATRGEGRSRIAWLVASGALAAAACWIKQSAAIALLVAPALVVLRPTGTALGARIRSLGWWLAGGVGLSALVVLPFTLAGAWDEFWYWSFTHSALYTDWSWRTLGAGEWLANAGTALGELGRDAGVILAVGAVGGAIACRERGFPAAVALAFLAASFASALHSAFLYPHYLAQLAPALALTAGIGFARLAHLRGRATTIAALALICVPPLLIRPEHWIAPDPVKVSLRMLGPQAFEASPLVADLLREDAAPSDRVLVVGSEPQIPFLAELRSVNPYGMLYPLTGPFPRRREFQHRLLDAFGRDPPRTVLFVRRIDASLQIGPHTDVEFLHEIERRVRAGYRLEALLVHDSEAIGWRLIRVDDAAVGSRLEAEAFVTVWRR